ncbi:hypothetical protein CAOG_01330 [Capsaspora owczarzaki ATCC 30864]|uniref:Uncharacterized protein n=1 Tax=Capsaspora owczarzaki (strain ATCC 30864) TaxID=595528 RepID=A0A0D2WIZ3_CAPO3|nr:hypothetical protein CAOG_01330 [Capsaspora owczarzaki ATCC 30864]KJE89930.1 hypothetical protein CAOG_001330 [Capsaspora owczarzaki ATCC 30864]|eukprot:XP_004349850.1 hypothetical protein CAOG_01330 [Capsaspora owczarzaki ATCC 30864]
MSLLHLVCAASGGNSGTATPPVLQGVCHHASPPSSDVPHERTPEVCALVVQELLRAGASPTQLDYSGQLPLHLACAAGNDAVALALIEADPSLATSMACTADCRGSTPLMVAIRHGRTELALNLLERHMSQSLLISQDRKNWTALHWASALNAVPVMRALLTAHAPITGLTSTGKTVLHLAALEGHIEACRLLLHHGALANVVDPEGHTPAECARLRGWTTCASVIDSLAQTSQGAPKKRGHRSIHAPVAQPHAAAAVHAAHAAGLADAPSGLPSSTSNSPPMSMSAFEPIVNPGQLGLSAIADVSPASLSHTNRFHSPPLTDDSPSPSGGASPSLVLSSGIAVATFAPQDFSLDMEDLQAESSI